MKLKQSIPLALVLAAGMAGAAAAQTSTSPSTVTPPMPQTATPNGAASWNPQHPPSGVATQQTPGTAPQANYQPQPNNQMPSSNAALRQPGTTFPPPATSAQLQSTPQPEGSRDQKVGEAQARLQAEGLYNGPQDGVMDPDTRAAIAKFQEQHGLRRTENLDEPTMAALMNDQKAGSGSSTTNMTPPAPNANEAGTMAPIGAGGNATGQSTPR